MDLSSAQTVLVSGIVLGSLYAMMATGLSLIWTTLGIFNFAHGVFMTFGAYVAWQVSTTHGFGLGGAAGIALGVAALFGLGCLSEVLLVRRFLKRRDVVMVAVITTLAAAIFLENSIQLVWGPKLKQLPPLIEGNSRIIGVTISAHETLILVIAPVTLTVLWAFLKWTRLGSAIRAVGQNRELAALLGMNERALFGLAFGLSAGLAALAGILLGSRGFITPEMGNEPLVKSPCSRNLRRAGQSDGNDRWRLYDWHDGSVRRVFHRPVLDPNGLIFDYDSDTACSSNRSVWSKIGFRCEHDLTRPHSYRCTMYGGTNSSAARQ